MVIDGYCVLGKDREYDLSPDELLRVMDESGVEKSVIAPVDRALAVDNRSGNDEMLKIAHDHPDRFIPCCSTNPWYGQSATNELRRAAGNGALLLVLHPAVQGFVANDELGFPVLEMADELEIPVYFHTGFPGMSTPWQIVDLTERFPDLDIIMGHCGATDFWNDMLPVINYTQHLFFESSLSRPFIFKNYLLAALGQRCIMGSFAPLNNFYFEWESMRLEIPQDSNPEFYGGTLEKLLMKQGSQ
jgi:predicted TIM-barrel fold metal-dependent hydrolase